MLGIITALMFLVAACNASTCPTKCFCFLDKRGRNTVVCKEGGIVGPITLTNVSINTEVLNITAPEDNMNMLTMVPIFGEFKQLEEIHITRCNIPQLGMHFFWGLKKLDVLNLSQNNITQPLDHNFRGLSQLKELYLDDNRISSLPSGTFHYLHELRVLSLQRNRIEVMTTRIYLGIGKLRELKLSGNPLGELNPEVFRDIQELRTLECRGCALKEIKNFFHLLPHLTYLDLGDNEFKHLESLVFEDLSKLKHLKLDGNQITNILDSTFSFQTELKCLNLGRNYIVSIEPNGFSTLQNLTELDLGFNKLEGFDEGVFEPIANQLTKLVLSGNNIKVHELKRILQNLSIRELHLSHSGLTELIYGMFPETLVVLNLADNRLSSLFVETIPPLVRDLDISKNRFKGLDETGVQRLKNIKRLRLEKNPWACDLCHIMPLLELAPKKTAIYDIKCASPYNFEGKLLGTIKRSELTWCITPSYTSSDANYFLIGDDGSIGLIAAGASVLLLFLTVVLILGALCYSRRHAAKYYTHEDKLAAAESESIFDNQSPLFTEDRELSFKFPLDMGEKKLSISTIDEIKKEHSITNGT